MYRKIDGIKVLYITNFAILQSIGIKLLKVLQYFDILHIEWALIYTASRLVYLLFYYMLFHDKCIHWQWTVEEHLSTTYTINGLGYGLIWQTNHETVYRRDLYKHTHLTYSNSNFLSPHWCCHLTNTEVTPSLLYCGPHIQWTTTCSFDYWYVYCTLTP